MSTETLETAESFDDDLAAPSAYESAIQRIDQTLKDVSGTSITSSSGVVDVMLDLRNDVEGIHDVVTVMFRIARGLQTKIDFYEEMFGEVAVPEGWQPAWISECDDLEEEPATI